MQWCNTGSIARAPKFCLSSRLVFLQQAVGVLVINEAAFLRPACTIIKIHVPLSALYYATLLLF